MFLIVVMMLFVWIWIVIDLIKLSPELVEVKNVLALPMVFLHTHAQKENSYVSIQLAISVDSTKQEHHLISKGQKNRVYIQ